MLLKRIHLAVGHTIQGYSAKITQIYLASFENIRVQLNKSVLGPAHHLSRDCMWMKL